MAVQLIPGFEASNDELAAWLRANPRPDGVALRASLARVISHAPLASFVARLPASAKDELRGPRGGMDLARELADTLLGPEAAALDVHLFYGHVSSCLRRRPSVRSTPCRRRSSRSFAHDAEALVQLSSLLKQLTTPALARSMDAFATGVHTQAQRAVAAAYVCKGEDSVEAALKQTRGQLPEPAWMKKRIERGDCKKR